MSERTPYSDSLGRLRRAMADVSAELLRRSLAKENYRGLESLDLPAIVHDVGVKRARGVARYYNNVLRDSRMPAMVELLLALYLRKLCEERFRGRGWLT